MPKKKQKTMTQQVIPYAEIAKVALEAIITILKKLPK